MSTILVLFSARSRLSSLSSSTSTSAVTAITAVRRTATAAACSEKSTALCHNLLHQQTTSFFSTAAVSPTTYDGCLSRNNNKQHQSHHQDVVIKVGLMSHTKQQQLTQQQQDQSRRDSNRSSSLRFTSSNKNIDNIDTDINRSDSNNNDSSNNNHFSRPPASSLLRFCQFNPPLSSSFLSTQLSHYHRHHHQHQHQLSSSSSSSSSSSLSLSSSMLMMPALCSPSRLCSSSSSSSQPSSENNKSQNENNDNNNNKNNDKFDVTSFADSAKKILREKKIATLICTKTVRDVLPTDYFDEENLVKNKKLFTEETYKSNLPAIAKIIFTPAAEILSSPTASDLNLTLKQFEMMSYFLATIQLHPTMTEFIKDDDFRLVANLNVLQIITVYDWYMSVAEARQELQPSQVELINRRCAGLYRKAEAEIAKHRERVKSSLQSTIQRSGTSLLRPYSCHRHATYFGFDALARESLFEKLRNVVKRTRDSQKERQSLIMICSMPRQGKTRLCDELGYRLDFCRALGAQATRENTFIFNLTFNSNWKTEVSSLKEQHLPVLSPSLADAVNSQIADTIERAIDSARRNAIESRQREQQQQQQTCGVHDPPEQVMLTAEEEKQIRDTVRDTLELNSDTQKRQLVGVERELCRRVVAAAVGIFASDQYVGEIRLLCDEFIAIHDYNFNIVCNAVEQMVVAQRGEKHGSCHFVYIFDEITNLGDALAKAIKDATKKANRTTSTTTRFDTELSAHFYSSINSVIDRRHFVILSGFSEPQDALGGSGRVIESIKLQPISSVVLRRELHVMKAAYFNFVAGFSPGSQIPREALLLYELVKSNPALMGTFLERLSDFFQENPEKQDLTTINEVLLDKIPVLEPFNKLSSRTSKKERMAGSMRDVLKLKSIQCCSLEMQVVVQSHSAGDKVIPKSIKLGELVASTLHNAASNNVADVVEISENSGIALPLMMTRLEPLFLQAASSALSTKLTPDGALVRYWSKLKEFSSLLGDLTSEEGERGRSFGLKRLNATRKMTATNNNNNNNNNKNTGHSVDGVKGTLDLQELKGAFFEDAVATGLLAQRQFRREQMLTRLPPDDDDHGAPEGRPFWEVQKTAAATLEDYLHGSEVIFSFPRPTHLINSNCPHQFPSGFIHWWNSNTRSTISSSLPSIVTFGRNIRYPLSERSKDWKRNSRGDPPSINVSTSDVFLPEDPKNPVVDVLVNEVFSSEIDKGDKNEELVQFWIDTKHKKDFNFPLAEFSKKKTAVDKTDYKTNGSKASIDPIDDTKKSNNKRSFKNSKKKRKPNNNKHNSSRKNNNNDNNLRHTSQQQQQHQRHQEKEEASFGNTAARFRNSLQDPLLTDAGSWSRVRHIVHVIISPFDAGDEEFTRKKVALQAALEAEFSKQYHHHPKKTVSSRTNTISSSNSAADDSRASLPSPLKSYTLCFVTPDDLSSKKAFENLVSQPIALTVPLIEQQLKESWTNDMPPRSKWWNYRATKNSQSHVAERWMLATNNISSSDNSISQSTTLSRENNTVITNQRHELLHGQCIVSSQKFTVGDFEWWRTDRFRGDLATGVGHLFASQEIALLSLKCISGSYSTSKSLNIPFACVLEALKLLPNRMEKLKEGFSYYCEYNPENSRFRLSLSPSSSAARRNYSKPETDNSNSSSKISIINNNNDNGNPDGSVYLDGSVGSVEERTKFTLKVGKKWLLDQIRVGHLLRFEHRHDYHDPLKKKAPLPSEYLCEGERQINHQESYAEDQVMSDLWAKLFKKYRDMRWTAGESDFTHERQFVTMTCSDLWNMSLNEFGAVIVKGGSRAEFNQLVDELLLLPSGETKSVLTPTREEALAKLQAFVADKIKESSFDLRVHYQAHAEAEGGGQKTKTVKKNN